MPQNKKGVSQQRNRKLKKDLHQIHLQVERNQAVSQTMEAAMKEKDAIIEELRASLTKQDDELKKHRAVALEYRESILQLQTKTEVLQNVASDKVDLMIQLEKENTTFKEELKVKEENIAKLVSGLSSFLYYIYLVLNTERKW